MASRPSVNPNQLFLDDDDIDDDTFLRNSRNNQPTSNPFDDEYDQRQVFEQRKREIEERTLNSTERSLGLLRDTEVVGVATAEELARQREQLENTSKQLDDINATLRVSQTHLNGIKSIFGSLKNYISGQKKVLPPPSSSSQMSLSASSNTVGQAPQIQGARTPEEQYMQHPTTRLRTDPKPVAQNGAVNSYEKRLENNLGEMSDNLSRLKHLAIDMNTEIVTSNDLIDKIHDKVENVDMKIGRQNREMNKLLGKK